MKNHGMAAVVAENETERYVGQRLIFLLNLLSESEIMERRIETKESRTAEMVCLIRAISSKEKNIFLKSDDYIAFKIIPDFSKLLFGFSFFRNFFKKMLSKIGIPGIYEYVITRTKYIDEIFKNLDGSFEQVLIFGAGFDSRAVRFSEKLKNVKIFEIDSPITQKAKIERFKKMNIEFPLNLKFVSVDFLKEKLEDKLKEAGFLRNKKSLFVLEGLTMYLDKKSIDQTFEILKEYSKKGSLIVFDYVYLSVLLGKDTVYGSKKILESTEKVGEKWMFGIEKGGIDKFLGKYGFELIDEADPEELQKRFLTDKNGGKIGRINEVHSIVTVRKK